MTATTAHDAPTPAAERQRRLATSVAGLRTRVRSADAARVLLVAGGVLLPLGFLLMLLGWLGAANTVQVYEQIPYQISGGLFGLGLVFAGGFCYFAYWLTQIVHATRRDAAGSRELLEEIRDLLSVAPRGAVEDAGRVVASRAAFVATSTGTMFHRPDCPSVLGRTGLRDVDGVAGLTACRICDPC